MKTIYYIPLLILYIISLYLNFTQSEKIKQLEDKKLYYKNTTDSLTTEIFNKETIVERYEMALEYYKELDSANANKFDKILHTETE